jgi:hypothetical protein
MTRIILSAVICALLLASCAGSADPDSLDFDRAFSFTAEIEYAGSTSTADFARTAAGEWDGIITAPFSLQGVNINYTPDEMSVSYSDFAVNIDPGTAPDINVSAFLMFKTLENAFALQNVSIASGRDSIEISGMFDGDSYILRLDREGLPVSLEIPRRQLWVTFSGVTTSKLLPPSDLE